MVIQPQKDGRPVDAMDISLRWQDTSGQLEFIERGAEKQDDGFVSSVPEVPVDSWSLVVTVLIDDFTSVRFKGEIATR